MTAALDRAVGVRAGEELPVDRLEAHLRRHFPAASGPLVVRQFPHGHSNLTYLLRLGDQELVLRRPPFGNQVKSAHDMSREYRVLSKLSAVYPPAPRPYFYCDDESVLGVPFYVMERRHGVVLRKTLPPDLQLDAAIVRKLDEALIDNLARLHMLDYGAAGLGDLGKPEGYVSRQVTGWVNRYAAARTDDVPVIERVARWLSEHQPPSTGAAALIHNDYKFDNLLLDPNDLTRIVAVLDWEMATLGDPLMDLGTSLSYWIAAADAPGLQVAAFGPTSLSGSMSRRELAERYAAQTNQDISNIVFYYCFGLFKTAVIVQQIYARYVRGHTHDARFANLNETALVLSQQAEQAAQTGKL